jgi:hypothetical protein
VQCDYIFRPQKIIRFFNWMTDDFIYYSRICFESQISANHISKKNKSKKISWKVIQTSRYPDIAYGDPA